MKLKMRGMIGIFLSIVMLLTCTPGMSKTTYAYDGNPYAGLVLDMRGVSSNDTADTLSGKTVKFGGYEWYIIEDKSTAARAGTLTLFAVQCIGKASIFDRYHTDNHYSTSYVKEMVVDAMTNEGGALYPVAGAISPTENLSTVSYDGTSVYDTVNGSVKCYLLDTATASKLPIAARLSELAEGVSSGYGDYYKTNKLWWLRSPGNVTIYPYNARCVKGLNGDLDETDAWTALGIRPALQLDLSKVIFLPESKTFSLEKEAIPDGVTFSATGTDSGKLSGVTAGMKYQVGDGSWTDITESNDIDLKDISVCTIRVIKKGDGITKMDSDPKEITVTKAAVPTTPAAVDCTNTENNDGKLTGVTAQMEYKKSDSDEWIPGTDNDITGLAPGTYYVRMKPEGTVLASDNKELTIREFENSKAGEAKVPLTDTSTAYASSEDNFAPVALGSSGGVGGNIKKLELDFSNIPGSGVDPEGLKMTAINGSKFTTKEKLKDKDSAKAEGGVKVKVNKKTLIPAISCKGNGSVTLTLDNGNKYTIMFTVQKPKAQASEKNITKGSGPVKKTVRELFGTDIDGGKLKIMDQSIFLCEEIKAVLLYCWSIKITKNPKMLLDKFIVKPFDS